MISARKDGDCIRISCGLFNIELDRDDATTLVNAVKHVLEQNVPVKRLAGQRYMCKIRSEEYILAKADYDQYALISLINGNRWKHPLSGEELQVWSGWSDFNLIK